LRIKTLTELAAEIAGELAEYEDTGVSAPSGKSMPVVRTDGSLTDKLTRLPLGEANIEYLSTCTKPQTAKQIANALRKAGREFESDNPVRAVKDALKKSLVKNKDLFHVRWATWYLKSKCNKAKYAKLIGVNATYGTGGRAPAEHGELTRQGMLKAREEGKQIGALKKISDEKVALIRRIILDGGTIGAACKRADISYGTFYTYREAGLLGELPKRRGRPRSAPKAAKDLLSDIDDEPAPIANAEAIRLRVVK